jgi:hypothetical protein
MRHLYWYSVYLFSVCIVLISCANPKSVTQQEGALQTSAALASIKKGACNGKCPTFEAVIYEDGRVEYVGTRFVAQEGKHVLAADSARAKAVIALFEKYGFAHMPASKLSNQTADLAPVTLSFRGKKLQHVTEESTPENLILLENELESGMGISNFIRNEM